MIPLRQRRPRGPSRAKAKSELALAGDGSEKHPPRIDLHDFRWDLNLIENGFNEWKFTGVNAIISRLKLKQEGGSSIGEWEFIDKLKKTLDLLKN